MELGKMLESLVISLAESQKVIISKLNVDKTTSESVALLETAGNNLREILSAYEKLSADQDLLTAEMVLDMNFFPPSTMSIDKIYRLARAGKMPAIRLDGRVFFSRKALREFVQEECRSNVISLEVKRKQKRRKDPAVGYGTKITAIQE